MSRTLMKAGSGADEWYLARGRRSPAAGHGVSRSAAGPRSGKRPTSSTCGSTPAAATLRCWRRAPTCAGRPRCTSRARTSIAGGSTPRSWRRWARGTRRPTAPSSPTASWWTATGRKMSKSGGNNITPDELHPELRRRRAAAVGGGGGLYRGHPALRRDPRTASPTPTGASGTRAASCSGTLADFDPDRDRVSYDAHGRARPLGAPAPGSSSRASRRAYEDYQYHVVFHATHNFCAVDLSVAVPRHHQGPALRAPRPTTRADAPRRPSASRCSPR